MCNMKYYEQVTIEQKKEALEKLLKTKRFVEGGFVVPEDATESEKRRLYSGYGVGNVVFCMFLSV